jgi:hypothetical protein
VADGGRVMIGGKRRKQEKKLKYEFVINSI